MDTTPFEPNLERIGQVVAASIDVQWVDARTVVEFLADDATQAQLRVRTSASSNDVPMKIRSLWPLVAEFRAIRKALVAAGNPKCKKMVFRLSSDGSFDLDVTY